MPPRLPDPTASRAVLVGVSRYSAMPENRQLPAVKNNLQRLATLLGEPQIWGLPSEHCVVLHQPDDADAVISALQTAAREATASLFFYYAGHGLTDPLTDDELHLALPNSREPAGIHLALRYQNVRAELLRAAAVPQKTVILDCCWSGKALKGATMGTDDLATVAAVKGTAVLTACASTAKALSPAGEDCTAFTGALTQILYEGIRGGPRELDIATLFRSLDTRLGSENRPRPQLATSGFGSGLVLAMNTWQEPAQPVEAQEVEAPPVPDIARPPGPVNEDARGRIQELLRTGRYGAAQELRLRLAEAGDISAIRDVVAQLRREGHYRFAAQLNRAVPGSDAAQQVLQWLRQGSLRKL
ncbi:caspase domain-containing protein [Streptomyces longwoodensis]|uniref:caspase family protein n=1 Tax=Streptomyces longwoodensis TaxID=68231 RepID=UPI003682DD64